MSSPSDNMMEVTIPPKPMDKPQRTSGDKHSGGSIGYVIYAGEGINLFFPIIAAMKKPKKVLGCPSLLCAGMITLAAFALVLSGAGLTPFCTKNYGTVYWMGIVAVIALLEAITAFIAGTVMNIIEWSRADYSGYETFC
uniref:Uncharacterized protein n=1 Tax=Glossina pallidipes TaxID=7398 RepID=A0A1A9ZYH9_GLOPL